MSHEDILLGFISKDLGWQGKVAELSPDYDLLENGVVDSLGIMKLVGLIEDHFGMEIPDEKLVPENFVSIRALSSLIDSNDST